MSTQQRLSPTEQWSPSPGTTAWISGPNWGVYAAAGSRVIVGGGDLAMDSAGDVVDAGTGDDLAIGGLGSGPGKDTLQGGEGDDLYLY